jgi:pyruvate dehydrogenase E1 component alpha subunit
LKIENSRRLEMTHHDIWYLYKQMLRSRLFEMEVIKQWEAGHISGEMHMGLGEEGVCAGIVSQLAEGDAMALDHRGTPPLVMRGIDPVLLMKEFLGREDGLCRGMGGHMHLFSPNHLAASSGIVGASGPAAAGFALAAQHLRPGKVSVAFFGEGAANQGMMMEAMNLASAWKLPVLFICKNNSWAITTRSPSVTGGDLTERARGFGMPAETVDGKDPEAVRDAAAPALARARQGEGPSFLMAHIKHAEGHFLGDPLLRAARHPLKEITQMAGPMVKSIFKPKGTSAKNRVKGMGTITSLIMQTFKEKSPKKEDPLVFTRAKLEPESTRLGQLETGVEEEIRKVMEAVSTGGGAG